MEWLAQLQGQIVGLDTAPLIYFIERNPTYLEKMRLFFRALNQGEFRVVTSIVTLTEVFGLSFTTRNTILAQQYRDIMFDSQGFSPLQIDPDIAEIAAQLRADYTLRTPDAIQLATAVSAGASFFLTNDTRLPSLPKLSVLLLNQLTA